MMVMVSVILFQSHAFNHVQVFSWQKVLSKCEELQSGGQWSATRLQMEKTAPALHHHHHDGLVPFSNEKSGFKNISTIYVLKILMALSPVPASMPVIKQFDHTI